LAERSPGVVPFEELLRPTSRTDVATGTVSSYSVSLDFRVFVPGV